MIRKPLILNSGNLEQLQAGDRLAPVPNTLDVINGEAASILPGGVVYISSDSTIKYAQADSILTKDAIALCISEIISSESGIVQTDGTLTLTITQWDLVTGDTGGLIPGTVYFLSETTNGRITKTAPINGYVVKIGVAISTVNFEISIGTPIKL